MKAYIAHPISTTGEFNDSKRVANRVREEVDLSVYAAAENDSINKKSNNPTPEDIYNADVKEVVSSDVVIANITGGHADGTIFETGVVSGYNEAVSKVHEIIGSYTDGGYSYEEACVLAIEAITELMPIPIVAYTSNARLQQPQFHKNVPSASANHLVLGGTDKWGSFVGGEDNMLEKLIYLKESDSIG